jgi:hypothetical protein
VDAWPDAGPGAFGHHDRHVRSSRISPNEGVTALFGLGAINRGVPRPWLRLSTLGDFVSMLESAWGCPLTHLCLQELDSIVSE